jgi:hypothetical protein
MRKGSGGVIRKRSKTVRGAADAESQTKTAEQYEAENRRLDEALIESFPASDPMAVRIEPNTPAPSHKSRKLRPSHRVTLRKV